MKGFKKTGKGPHYGEFKFPRTSVEVRTHSRNLPAKKFAEGGLATNGALTKRSQPVTDLDRESGGKSPLRPGFAEGGKTGNLSAALRAVRRMVDSGLDATVAARKAAAAHGVDESALQSSSTKKGMKSDPQMLAIGGPVRQAFGRVAGRALAGRLAPPAAGPSRGPLAQAGRASVGRIASRPAPQSQKYARGGATSCPPPGRRGS